jgi:hypothetical protein
MEVTWWIENSIIYVWNESVNLTPLKIVRTLGCQIDEYTRLFGTKETWRKKQTQRETKVFNKNPPYSFIWPYSFNWHLRVGPNFVKSAVIRRTYYKKNMIFSLIGTKIWIKNITKKLKYVFSIFSCFVFLKNHRLDNFFWYRQGLHAWLNVACNQCKIQDNDHSLNISNLFSCYCASNPCEISGFANVWKFVHSRIGHIWIFLLCHRGFHEKVNAICNCIFWKIACHTVHIRAWNCSERFFRESV